MISRLRFLFRRKVGIDTIDIGRFREFEHDRNHAFLRKTYTEQELDYCFTHKDAAPHLAGMFAAKEAISKALGTNSYPFAEIEIRHGNDGAPIAYRHGKELAVSVSITHTDYVASAVAVG